MDENCIIPEYRATILRGHKAEAFTCTWNPVKDMLASAGADNTALIWNIAEKTHPKVLHHCIQRGVTEVINARDVTLLAWRRDGTLLATGCYDSFVRIWNRDGMLERTLTGHKGPIYAMKWHNTCDLLVLGSSDKTVSVWNPCTGACIWRFRVHTLAVSDVDWQSDVRIASCSIDLSIAVCDIGSNKPIKIFQGHTNEINTVKWDPQGNLLASCSDDATIKIWSMGYQNCVCDFRAHTKEIYAIKWAPCGPGTDNPNMNLVLASGSFDSTVRMWDVERGVLMKTMTKHTEPVNSIAFSPDGKFLASAGFDRYVHIWSVRNADLVRSYQGPAGMFEVCWNAHSDKIAASATDGSILVLDLRN